MRTYEQTHRWISFQFDLSKAHPELWLGLGEAASKCEHISRVPLRPSTAQRLHQLYLAKGAAAFAGFEGVSKLKEMLAGSGDEQVSADQGDTGETTAADDDQDDDST